MKSDAAVMCAGIRPAAGVEKPAVPAKSDVPGPAAAGRVIKRWWKRGLTDHELTRALREAIAHDFEHTAELIALIAEYDARRLYRAAACSSMFDYCVRLLGMSNDVAAKRIRVARAARRHPAIVPMLADGRLHVSGVAMLASYLTSANSDELLAAAAGLTKALIERLLAQRYPQADLPALLVAIPSASTVHAASNEASEAARTLPAPGPVTFEPVTQGDVICVESAATHEASALPVNAPATSSAIAKLVMPAYSRVTPRAPDRHALQVMLDDETRALLERAQDLLAPGIARSDLANVLKRCLKLAVERLEQRRCAATSKPRAAGPRSSANPRHIPAAIRRAVRARDGERCTFESNGQRCEARHGLHMDHTRPVADGGESTPANLRLLCGPHNQLMAERRFGEAFMQGKREQRRLTAANSS